MADDLDDFFAKKDKSKKKGKSSKNKLMPADLLPKSTESSPVPPEEITEKLNEAKIEDTSDMTKEKKKTKKRKDKDPQDEARRKEDDEWLTVEDKKDYSNLRIANRNLLKNPNEGEDEDEESDQEFDEHGQPKQTEGSSVWNRQVANESEDNDDDSTRTVANPPAAELPNVSGGRYIPPSMRGAAAGSSASSRTASGDLAPVSIKKPQRKKVAPNLASQEDFPILGSAPPPVDYDIANFEKVKGGASSSLSQSRSSTTSQNVETTNKYGLLQQ